MPRGPVADTVRNESWQPPRNNKKDLEKIVQFAAASNPIIAYVAGCKRGKLPKEMESAMILRLAFRPRIRGSNLGECDRRRSQL